MHALFLVSGDLRANPRCGVREGMFAYLTGQGKQGLVYEVVMVCTPPWQVPAKIGIQFFANNG
jgi:hypothetical protein